MLRTLSDRLLSIVYPQECRVCGGEVTSSGDGVACSDCWKETKIFSGNETLCFKCGAFLFDAQRSSAAFCHKCDDHAYDQALAIGHYEKALSANVLHLKRVPLLPLRIKNLLDVLLERSAVPGDAVVIPVPLSPRRLRERGFNQAWVIGQAVSGRLGLALDDATLARTAHTPMHRAGMDRKARAKTVANAFQVVRPKLIEGKSVLLVDDIFTSGETASSCARSLKESGASSVVVLTIARTA